MGNILQHSNNGTQLANRFLWNDGDSTVTDEFLKELLLIGTDFNKAGVYVDEVSPEIEQYNKFVNVVNRIGVKTKLEEPKFEWNIPEEYKKLNLIEYVYSKLEERNEDLPVDEWNIRAVRAATELAQYQRLGLNDILRAIIYVINKLETEKVVWGVGRGSSVSSYVLYLIGVHDVDSVAYDLDINDFLRT